MLSDNPLEDPERNIEDQEAVQYLLHMGEEGPIYEKSELLAIEERNYLALRAKLAPDGDILASGAQGEEDRMILLHSLRRIRDIHERQRVFEARKSLEEWHEILIAHLIERVLMHRDYVTGVSSQEQIDRQSVLSILPEDVFFSVDLDEQEIEVLDLLRAAGTEGPTVEKIYLSQLMEQWAQLADERESGKRATDRVFVHTLRFIRETQKRQWLYEKRARESGGLICWILISLSGVCMKSALNPYTQVIFPLIILFMTEVSMRFSKNKMMTL